MLLLPKAAKFSRQTPIADMTMRLFEAWVEHDPTSSVARFPASYLATFGDLARVALSATPSPIEDVAGPSEGEDGKLTHDEFRVLFGDEIPIEAINYVFVEAPPDTPMVEVRRKLREIAARRVRPSLVDEDAGDGMLVDALRAARDQITLLGGEPVAGDLNADQIQVAVLGVIDDALQSQRKG